MKFPAGIEARRVPLPQGRASESWSPEEGEASANMRWGHFNKPFWILIGVTSTIKYFLNSDDPSQEFEATVFFSSTKQKPIILHYNTVSKVAKLYAKRFKIVQKHHRARLSSLIEWKLKSVAQTQWRTLFEEPQNSLLATELEMPVRLIFSLVICNLSTIFLICDFSTIFSIYNLSTGSKVSSAKISLPIDHRVSPNLKLVVFVNEVTFNLLYPKIQTCWSPKKTIILNPTTTKT